jgi:SNF2 family DNA or RNA helicase
MLDKLKIRHVDIYSGTPSKKEAVDDFNSPQGARVLIGQVHSGGIGINLVSSSLVVYYSNSYSLGDRVQSEDRTHRIGQTKNVTYIDLVCKDTIDATVLKILKAKKNLADIVTGGDLKGVINNEDRKGRR